MGSELLSAVTAPARRPAHSHRRGRLRVRRPPALACLGAARAWAAATEQDDCVTRPGPRLDAAGPVTPSRMIIMIAMAVTTATSTA